MLVFSMKKCLEDIGGVFDGGLDREWAEDCDGQEVVERNGSPLYHCKGKYTGFTYDIHRDWTEEV